MTPQRSDVRPIWQVERALPPARVWGWAVMELVRRDLKVRYKNSALGVFWSFLNPAMQVVILTVVFKFIMGSTVSNFSVELFTVLLPWMLFSQALNDGAVCVAKDALLVRKYAFPRIIIPISTLASNFVHLVFGLLVLGLLFLVLHVSINVGFLWVLPLLAIQSCLMLGLILLLATLHMFYADIKFLLGSAIQLLFFLSPTVYTIEQVMNSSRLTPFWREMYLSLNPLAPLFIGYRTALLHGSVWPVPHYLHYVALSLVWALAFLGLGILVWRHYAWRFAELGS